MSRFIVLALVMTSGCNLLGSCPEDVEPLVSGSYEMSFDTWGERLDVREATAVYDREAGELTVTYVREDGAEVVQELDVGQIGVSEW